MWRWCLATGAPWSTRASSRSASPSPSSGPARRRLERRRAYANIAIHELGHYWFGDVVTCRVVGRHLAQRVPHLVARPEAHRPFEPAWNYALDGQASSAAFAFEMDSLTTTPPVRKPITTNDDIIGSFDNSTTYAKGSALLSMLEGWRGMQPVRDMLRAHVRKHAWGVATSEDFLATVGKALGPGRGARLPQLHRSAGRPSRLRQLECKAGAAPRLKLSQERFLPAGSRGGPPALGHPRVRARGHGQGLRAARARCSQAPPASWPCRFRAAPRGCCSTRGARATTARAIRASSWGSCSGTPSGTLTTAERLALLGDVHAAVDRGDVPLGEALKLGAGDGRGSQPPGAGVGLAVALLRPSGAAPRGRTASATGRGCARLYGARARAWAGSPSRARAMTRSSCATLLMLARAPGQEPTLSQEADRLARAWLADRKSVDPEAGDAGPARGGAGRRRALFDRCSPRPGRKRAAPSAPAALHARRLPQARAREARRSR